MEEEVLLKLQGDVAFLVANYIKPAEKSGWLSRNLSSFVAFTTLLGTFALFYFSITGNLAANKEIVFYILGVLSSALTTVLGYFFGSSVGSIQKNNLIAKMRPPKHEELKEV